MLVATIAACIIRGVPAIARLFDDEGPYSRVGVPARVGLSNDIAGISMTVVYNNNATYTFEFTSALMFSISSIDAFTCPIGTCPNINSKRADIDVVILTCVVLVM